ncbi:MAG: hypothetical protein WAK57_16480 [Desulfobacterales bacterium]
MPLEPSAGSTRHRLIDSDRLPVSGLRRHFIQRLRGPLEKAVAIDAFNTLFPGRNGWRFHLAGLVHPRLRTCLLPGELVRRAGQKIQVCLGRPIPWAKLRRLPDDRCRTGFLRANTYLLQNRKKPGPRLGTAQAPIAVPMPNSRVAGEIAELGPTY